MSKNKSTLLTKGVCVGLLLGTAAITPNTGLNNLAKAMSDEDKEIGSISLNPKMYIPDSSEFINQPVDEEDVKRTLELKTVAIAINSALAELSAGVENHLGYKTEELSQTQVDLYEENISYYSKSILELEDTASSEEEVLNVLQRFREWSSNYKYEITAEKNAKEVTEVETVDNTTEESLSPSEYISYGLPDLEDQYLTYMPYTAITAKNTPHYKLQQLATTNEEGYRVYDDAICVALGSAYGTKIGTLYNIKFSDGKQMRAVLSDNKSDKHTDSLHQYRDATGVYDGSSGNILEIVFDVEGYKDMYAVNRKINGDYSGDIVSITKIGTAKGF